ncbi:MAG: hypothetical protein Q8R98_15105, partial [Rubrivivax sp.]|nr:hypothetical protein [Rubrivivax sp.]
LPLAEQITVLELITQLDEYDHKAWRFLGESLRRAGATCERVQSCFERALQESPSFPPYLANLGHVLLSRGADVAQIFLDRLDQHRQKHAEAVNDHVLAIAAQCLIEIGQVAQASQLRCEQIKAGSRNPAFYNDEADYQLSLGQFDEALRLLDIAQQRGVADGYSVSIRATVLAKSGNEQAASQLRCEQIEAGSRNPAFYTAEADYQLSLGRFDEAQRLLNQVNHLGIADGATRAMQAKLNKHR